jgi:hypothetical protein
MLIINRFVLGKLWQPFFITLSELTQFDLPIKKRSNLANSSIKEFGELNVSVIQMTEKVCNEYETLKAFTHAGFHERQTAYILPKLKMYITQGKV